MTKGDFPRHASDRGAGWLAHLIHRLYCRTTRAHTFGYRNNMDRAIPLLAGPRFRPYLSGARG